MRQPGRAEIGPRFAVQDGDGVVPGAPFGVTGPESNLRVVVTVKRGGPLLVGASLIDNAISSIAYVPSAKVDAPDDGAYGWVVTQGDAALASAGRLDVFDGAPNFLSGLLVVDCQAGSFIFTVLAYGADSGVTPNTAFTPLAGGGWGFEGSAPESGAWAGTVLPWVAVPWWILPPPTACPTLPAS